MIELQNVPLIKYAEDAEMRNEPVEKTDARNANAAALGLDLKKIKESDPVLFVHLRWTLAESKSVAERAMRAYAQLVARGALEYDFKRNERIAARLAEVKSLADGPCLIDRDEIKELIIEEVKRGNKQTYVDYCGLQHAIETAYKIDVHDVISYNYYEDFGKIMGYTKTQISEASRVVPAENDIAMEMTLFYTIVKARAERPYVNLWHETIDVFDDVSNGCTRTLGRGVDQVIETRVSGGRFVQEVSVPGIYGDFVRIIFKEMSQVLGEVDEIEFRIEW